MAKLLGLSVKVEEIAFGKVWSTLDSIPGVVTITIEGSAKPMPNGKSNGKKSNGSSNGTGKTVQRLILEALLARSPLTKFELQDHIAAAGKSRLSLPDQMAKLREEKCVKLMAAGNYSITAKGTKQATTELES